jgi:hypothetical protein
MRRIVMMRSKKTIEAAAGTVVVTATSYLIAIPSGTHRDPNPDPTTKIFSIGNPDPDPDKTRDTRYSPDPDSS